MSRIRITGGTWRSRLVEVSDTPGLRPTPDRVRETLFNWLGQDLSGWTCLDLFAGSGILSFEALSRGATRATLVERDARAVRILDRNKQALNAEQMTIVRADAVEFAAAAGGRGEHYDMVFVDPPYRQEWWRRLWPCLASLAKPETRLYAEAEAPLTPPDAWRIVRCGQAGQVYYHLMERT